MVKNMLSLVVRKGAHAQRHTQSHKVIDGPFRNLETIQLGVPQGAFTIITGLNPDLECVENHQEQEKS